MTKLPELKIKGLGWDASDEIRDFNQAKYLPFTSDVIIMVEEQAVGSYEDLVKLIASDDYKDKEFLEVKLLSLIMGG